MVRKVIIFVAFIVLFIFFPGSIAAQEKVPDTEYAGKERWAYKTNALEWLLTIPNFGDFTLIKLPNTTGTHHTITQPRWYSI